jgi:hypothetical protein
MEGKNTGFDCGIGLKEENKWVTLIQNAHIQKYIICLLLDGIGKILL